MAELRKNPVTNDWIMIASHRQNRPVDVNKVSAGCPFCPGPGKKIENDYEVLEYDNDFPALLQDFSGITINRPISPDGGDIYDIAEPYGKCEVILFSSDHNSTLWRLTDNHAKKLVDLWCERYTELSADKHIRYVFIFENRGEVVGVTMSHPHGQIYAYSKLPKKIELELINSKKFYEEHNGKCLFCRIRDEETEFAERVIYENDAFIAYVPFYADYAYGVEIMAKRHVCAINELDENERMLFGDAVKTVTGAYDALYNSRFPYMMCMHNAPCNMEDTEFAGYRDYYHFHVEFFPPMRSADKQQFMASSETGVGAHCNPTDPEKIAEQLRTAVAKYKRLTRVTNIRVEEKAPVFNPGAETVLVSGGAGYIGSHCCAALREKGYNVVVADNMIKGHPEAVNGFKLYTGNVGDPDFMDRVFNENKIDCVMHFAAYSLVGESMVKPYEYYQNNVGCTLSLLNSMKKHGVKKIVFSSTAATFGQPETSPITEETPQNPINTYGETKLAIEKMLKWFGQAYGINSVCLRYFNVAGAHESGNIGEAHNPETHLIPIILEVAAGVRDRLKIFGDDYPTPDGTCIRDYIHVMDLADAHIKAYEYMKETGKSDAFNLGSGGGYSNMQILEAARRITGKEIPADITARRAGDPPVLIASSKKAEELLGWQRKYGIDDIIATAWKWHSTHPFGYQR